VLDSIGYTDGNHAHVYTVAPNFRQASGSLNQANSTISSDDAADVYVNFSYDTTGKYVWVVYTTDGSAPNKSNGTSVAAAFSKSAEPNRTWYAIIPAQAMGATVNYVFYISDSDLASAWGRVSGATADRNTSQYEISWSESDGDYFTYSVCGKALTVTSDANDGAGSLRQAIADVCPGGSITFEGDTSIYLASELSISKRLTIDGGSYAVKVSGDTKNDNSRNVRVFYIEASGVVTLSHLSIVSGTTTSNGGGINNKGALTVQDCVLSDNVSGDNGGGIFNDAGGQMTVRNSILSGNRADDGGGGIGNRGALTLRDSTLSGNSASYGGGIFNADGGQMTVYNSTLSGNAATGDGGGAIDQWVSNGSVSGTIINSTIVNNTAVNAHTSGILLESGPLTLTNSIVANNNGGNVRQDGGTFIPKGYNLSNDWGTLVIAATDLTADPQLGTLADNGGGTWTHALGANSPAIDAGDPASCPATDQRGAPRDDLRCDIGAYERQFDDAGGDTMVRDGMTAGTTESFGPTRVGVTVTGGDAGTITATKRLATPGGVYNSGEITATWWLTASNSPFTVTLALCYTPEEFGDPNTDGLQAFRWDTTKMTWTLPISTGLTVTDGCVTLTGIEEFSAWTLKDVSAGAATPTAARVVGLATRGVVPFLAGLLALGGAAALRRRRR